MSRVSRVSRVGRVGRVGRVAVIDDPAPHPAPGACTSWPRASRAAAAAGGSGAGGLAADGSPAGGSGAGGLAAVSAALRAGAPPALAWQRGWGVRSDDGLPRMDDLVERCGGDASVAVAVQAAARLAQRSGAPPAAVLDRLGAALDDEQEIAGQRRAAMAGPRATARLLAWLPLFGVALGAALGANPVGVLLDGRLGTVLLAAAGLLSWTGRRWSSQLLVAAERAGAGA